VLEKYLASIENPNLTQVAMEAVASNVVKPIASGAKQRNRSARAPRGSNDVALGFNPRNDRWNRRAERRGGFGLFFFRRYARAEAAQ
jgi:hypothetical protein